MNTERKSPKIVFFGTPEFAVASLDALISAGFDVAAVVTMPDRIGGRGNKTIESAVKVYAREHSLPLMQPERLKDPEFVDALRAIGADLFIVIAFRMLPEVVWGMPPMGTFNLHASLLPRYRGAAPINRAVMAGDAETGVTTFLLKHEIDTGDILCQERIAIAPDENAGSVHDRLMALGAEVTVDTVRRLVDGTVEAVPQESFNNFRPSAAPKIFKDDCRLDWHTDAESVFNHIRGLAPSPGAWSELSTSGPEGEAVTTVKVLAAKRAGGHYRPGQLVAEGSKVMCGCADGAVELVEVQPAGKRRMAAADWLRGLAHGQKSADLYLR